MTGSAPGDTTDYVLGTDISEVERLALQHRLWADAAHQLWRLAGVGPGARVLDVGCGPGHAALDLADLVLPLRALKREGGSVIAVDGSPAYVEHLQRQARHRGHGHVRGVRGDVQRLEALLPECRAQLDVAYARWVLCFVEHPEEVVVGVARLLRPGGRFAIHDFFNYGATTTAPRRASYDRAVAATIASWRARGGDPDVAGRLPRILMDHGFDVVHHVVHQRVAHPGDPMFAWAESWWRTFAPRLVETAFLGGHELVELLDDLDAVRASPAEFVLPPPVTELLAVKR